MKAKARAKVGAARARMQGTRGRRRPSELLAEALRLSSAKRAEMAGWLLRGRDEEERGLSKADYETAWTAEIAKRRRELERGEVQGMTPAEALRFIASDDPFDD